MMIRTIRPQDDESLAAIIRNNLREYGLDIPGTAYFDDSLDHLSSYYGQKDKDRVYLVLEDDDQTLLGGVGLERMPEENVFAGSLRGKTSGELQKLYLCPEAKGQGLGRLLVESIEREACNRGLELIYLETHTCLESAIHLYEKLGYEQIKRPDFVVHSAMDRFYIKRILYGNADL